MITRFARTLVGSRCSDLDAPRYEDRSITAVSKRRKKGRKERGGKRKKKEGTRKFLLRMEWDARGSVSLTVVSLSAPCSAQFSEGGVLVLYRSGVFYCPKTDRYQDYVFPSTSTLVSAIESDTKPVRGEGENRRDILFRSNGPRPVSEFAETFFAMKSPRLSKWRGRRKSRRGMDGLWRIRRGISGSK